MLSSMYSMKSKGTVASRRCVKYQDARMRWNSSRRTMSQRNWRAAHQSSSASRPSTGRLRRSGLHTAAEYQYSSGLQTAHIPCACVSRLHPVQPCPATSCRSNSQQSSMRLHPGTTYHSAFLQAGFVSIESVSQEPHLQGSPRLSAALAQQPAAPRPSASRLT